MALAGGATHSAVLETGVSKSARALDNPAFCDDTPAVKTEAT